MRLRRWAIALALVSACAGDDGAQSDGGTNDGPNGGFDDPGTGSECLVTNASLELRNGGTTALDLVFAIDDSASMASEQAALRDQLPRLLRALTSGDKDGDDREDFAPVRDLHIGVVSTDLGLPGVSSVPGCTGLGDDGVLNNAGSPDIPGCSPTYEPRFLSFNAGDVDLLATDLGCLTTLGTSGCGIEQPLESLLKAVWPADNMDVWFLPDPSGFGMSGQGGPLGANGAVVRDASEGGLVAFIVVTDDDDCSMGNTSHFAMPSDPDDPLSMQGLNTRCFWEAQRDRDPSTAGLQTNLYGPGRYVQALRALRPGREDLVVFGAIVGVPPDLVEPDDLAAVDFDAQAEADAFYDGILADARMMETLDDQGTPEPEDDDLVPSCNRGEDERTYPPRRILEVARGFGANGAIQSICQDDLRPAIDAIVDVIGKKLGEPCLPRALQRDGERIDCELEWELPQASSRPSDTPSDCEELPFLEAAGTSSRGGARCKLQQLAVRDGALADDGEEGWYYDDFSDAAALCVGGASGHRIAFTQSASPPSGVTVRLLCHDVLRDASQSIDAPACLPGPQVASAARVGDPCLTHTVPPIGFNDTAVYIEPVHEHCGGASCIVYHLGGDPREGCAERAIDCTPGEDGCPEILRCASPREIEERVYCSCRCDASEGLPTCECPDDFSCVHVLDVGPEAVQGGYCVRNSSVTN